MRLLSLVTLVVLTACGCGGGGGSSEPAAQQQSGRPTAAAYGDSTQSAPVPPTFEISKYRPSAVAASILGITIYNEGVGSTDSGQLLAGDGHHKPWPEEMAASTVRIVTINHGINDHRHSLDDYRANLEALVTIAQRAGKLVVLETPNPVISDDTANLALRVDVMREVAVETKAILCDEYAAIKDAGLDTPANLLDGVHPSDAIYLLKGQTLAKCLRPLV